MNERIKELAEFHSINVDVMQAIYDDIALLIVRECIDIGDNYQDILGDEPECVNCRKVAYGIVDKIKQHFGVEE